VFELKLFVAKQSELRHCGFEHCTFKLFGDKQFEFKQFGSEVFKFVVFASKPGKQLECKKFEFTVSESMLFVGKQYEFNDCVLEPIAFELPNGKQFDFKPFELELFEFKLVGSKFKLC